MRGIVEPHRGVRAQRRIREQTRLRPGNHEAFGHGLHGKAATFGLQVRGEARESAATGYLQPVDPQFSLSPWSGNGAPKLPLERDSLPGKVRRGSHRWRLQVIGEIRTSLREIEAALRERTQLARAGRDMQTLGV